MNLFWIFGKSPKLFSHTIISFSKKCQIAQQYLLPQVSEITGLKLNEGIIIDEKALNKLIKSYCRESGVRNLRKHIEKIFRKAAFINVSEGQTGILVNEDNLQKFVGKPVFTQDKMYENTPPGVCMGLAWTSHGGSTLYIGKKYALKWYNVCD